MDAVEGRLYMYAECQILFVREYCIPRYYSDGKI